MASLAWFVLIGILYVEKRELLHWLATFFLYLYGGQWVFSGIFKLPMYAPTIGTKLNHSNETHNVYRWILLLLGLFLMFFSSIY